MFWLRLSLALGRSLRETQEAVDAEEYKLWVAYDKIEPFGDRRADLRTATIAAILANQNRKRGQKPFTHEDFMPRFKHARVQSAEEVRRRLMLFFDLRRQAMST